MTVLALALSVAGCLCLCASMKRHHSVFWRRRLEARASKRLRAAGFVLLTAALALNVVATSVGLGLIYTCGHFTVGALAAVFVLEVRDAAAARGSRA